MFIFDYLTFGFKCTITFRYSNIRFSIEDFSLGWTKSFVYKVRFMHWKLWLLSRIFKLICVASCLSEQDYIIIEVCVHAWLHALIIWIIFWNQFSILPLYFIWAWSIVWMGSRICYSLSLMWFLIWKWIPTVFLHSAARIFALQRSLSFSIRFRILSSWCRRKKSTFKLWNKRVYRWILTFLSYYRFWRSIIDFHFFVLILLFNFIHHRIARSIFSSWRIYS